MRSRLRPGNRRRRGRSRPARPCTCSCSPPPAASVYPSDRAALDGDSADDAVPDDGFGPAECRFLKTAQTTAVGDDEHATDGMSGRDPPDGGDDTVAVLLVRLAVPR